jgi:hypothetical protein
MMYLISLRHVLIMGYRQQHFIVLLVLHWGLVSFYIQINRFQQLRLMVIIQMERIGGE